MTMARRLIPIRHKFGERLCSRRLDSRLLRRPWKLSRNLPAWKLVPPDWRMVFHRYVGASRSHRSVHRTGRYATLRRVRLRAGNIDGYAKRPWCRRPHRQPVWRLQPEQQEQAAYVADPGGDHPPNNCEQSTLSQPEHGDAVDKSSSRSPACDGDLPGQYGSEQLFRKRNRRRAAVTFH